MRGEHLSLEERAKEALNRIKVGHGQMRIPPEATDPDMVIVAQGKRIEALEAALRDIRHALLAPAFARGGWRVTAIQAADVIARSTLEGA